VKKPHKTDPVDDEVLRSAITGEGLVELTPELLQVLADSAADIWECAAREAAAVLTPDRAREVRAWRVDGGYTWRAVARAASEAWDAPWEPPSNQLAGQALCEAAARMLGEDPEAEPWN